MAFSAVDDVEQTVVTKPSQLGWRSHIDGMRAISILCVLLYHVGASQFSGGFVGVDVFFVISGFLISKVIYDDIAASGQFHIANFYERRVRRILPVFVVVTFATIVAGYFLLLPDDYAQLGKSVIYATGFAANIFFYLTSSYFGPAADTQPLLHYWSLGVEEQFYVVFPMLVLACSKFAPRLLAPSIFAIAIFSLALAEYCVRTAPTAAFYLAPQRAWELMAGSILALPHFPFPKRRVLREPAAALGLGLILFSIFAYGPKTPFPGATAAVPVIGAALILSGCDRGPTFVGSLLSAKPLRLIGLWSYSIYMIHWPLIVFCRQIWPNPSGPMYAALVIASVIFGGLSYLVVETPFRRSREILKRGRNPAAAALISIVVLMGAGAVVYASGGFAVRLPANVREVLAYQNFSDRAPLWRTDRCFLSADWAWGNLDKAACLHPEHPSALLWGDSHAAHLYNPLGIFFRRHGVELSQANMSSCAPILDFKIVPLPNCWEFNKKTFDWIKANRPNTIVLSALWPIDRQEYLEKIYKTIDEITALRLKVVVVGNTPRYPEPVPHILAKRLLRGDVNKLDNGKNFSSNTDQLFGQRYADSQTVIYISPTRSLCENSACPLAADDGSPLQFDSDHFTERGAEYAIHRMFDNPTIERRMFDASSVQ